VKLELFHVLVHPGCSRVRQWIVDHDLTEAVQFRNLHFPEHLEALRAHGAGESDVPCVWDGETLHRGADACIARLQAEQDLGRSRS
jgi:predicted DCC family thiol-disulfide oxidoreductase YuxK